MKNPIMPLTPLAIIIMATRSFDPLTLSFLDYTTIIASAHTLTKAIDIAEIPMRIVTVMGSIMLKVNIQKAEMN